VKYDVTYTIFCDGASRGNPGQASFGVVCFRGTQTFSLADFKRNESIAHFKAEVTLGIQTNNEAEYRAILYALEECKKRGIKNPILYSDSELVIKQLKGEYKVKDEKMKKLFGEVYPLVKELGVELFHIKRDKNKIADFLANRALDEAARG